MPDYRHDIHSQSKLKKKKKRKTIIVIVWSFAQDTYFNEILFINYYEWISILSNSYYPFLIYQVVSMMKLLLHDLRFLKPPLFER